MEAVIEHLRDRLDQCESYAAGLDSEADKLEAEARGCRECAAERRGRAVQYRQAIVVLGGQGPAQ